MSGTVQLYTSGRYISREGKYARTVHDFSVLYRHGYRPDQRGGIIYFSYLGFVQTDLYSRLQAQIHCTVGSNTILQVSGTAGNHISLYTVQQDYITGAESNKTFFDKAYCPLYIYRAFYIFCMT